MVAGFEVPDAGRIYLQGEDVTTLFSNRRPVNMVFQQYALFPHMSIYDNVAFGLEGQEGAALRARRAREGDAADRRARGSREAQAAAALGRPAAAGCPGARTRQLTRGPAARRAARRARREAAQADAAAAEGDPARRRHDLRLRHARPGRGARDVRPDRGHERRPGRADRQPARDLHAALDRFRGGLHRLAERARAEGRRAGRRLRGHAARRGRARGRRRRAGDAASATRCAWRCGPSRCGSRRRRAVARRRLVSARPDRRGRLSRHVHAVPRRHAGRARGLHRMADEPLAELEPGTDVVLEWQPEDAALSSRAFAPPRGGPPRR